MINVLFFMKLFFFKAFTLQNWANSVNVSLVKDLDSGALAMLLEQLNLTKFFSSQKCDRARSPYSPSLMGYHNGKQPTSIWPWNITACYMSNFFSPNLFLSFYSIKSDLCINTGIKRLSEFCFLRIVFLYFLDKIFR